MPGTTLTSAQVLVIPDNTSSTDVGNVFEIFSDFIQKCNFSVNYLRDLLEFFYIYGGSHMQHISNGFYLVTFRSPSKIKYRM